MQAALKLSQEDVLTFVIVPKAGRKIILKGDTYIGVHLVYLADSGLTELVPEKPFRLFGGLGLSRPGLDTFTKVLKKGNEETQIF